MKDINLNKLQAKLTIADTAAKLYAKKEEDFTLHDVARETGITVAELFDYFEDKYEILLFFYSSLIIRYRLMIEDIDDFENFTLSEKLSNFAYASFDLMAEREKFVRKTFDSYILHSCQKTEYEENIEELLSDFIKNDPGKAASSDIVVNDCSLRLIRKKYLQLVNFWLYDESEDKEMTMELVDKVTGLIQEALYTSVIDRSFDLAKFLFSNDLITQRNKFWDKISSTFEIR